MEMQDAFPVLLQGGGSMGHEQPKKIRDRIKAVTLGLDPRSAVADRPFSPRAFHMDEVRHG